MPNQFHQDIRETIERCRRLARSTHDMEMVSKLLAMAEEMEKALKHAPEQENDPTTAT